MENWLNDTNSGKAKYSEKTPSHCQSVRNKSHVGCSGFEPEFASSGRRLARSLFGDSVECRNKVTTF
jgi:hypothetical protein